MPNFHEFTAVKGYAHARVLVNLDMVTFAESAYDGKEDKHYTLLHFYNEVVKVEGKLEEIFVKEN